MFQEQMGVPPQRYYQQLRLEQAARLLRTTNCTVAEIADSCGYQNAFYFSTRFKHAFGKSPSFFRKTSAAH
jgi:transcriptional regulator GlxA family with amidase domain